MNPGLRNDSRVLRRHCLREEFTCSWRTTVEACDQGSSRSAERFSFFSISCSSLLSASPSRQDAPSILSEDGLSSQPGYQAAGISRPNSTYRAPGSSATSHRLPSLITNPLLPATAPPLHPSTRSGAVPIFYFFFIFTFRFQVILSTAPCYKERAPV